MAFASGTPRKNSRLLQKLDCQADAPVKTMGFKGGHPGIDATAGFKH